MSIVTCYFSIHSKTKFDVEKLTIYSDVKPENVSKKKNIFTKTKSNTFIFKTKTLIFLVQLLKHKKKLYEFCFCQGFALVFVW